MNINQAYVFCEKVANKDKQGLLGPSTFTAFAIASQNDAILMRAPLYGSLQSVSDDLAPVLVSLKEAMPTSGILPKSRIPRHLRSLHLVSALEPEEMPEESSMIGQAAEYEPFRPIDLISVDQFRIRSLSEAYKPTDEFPIATITKDGLHVLPKTVNRIIFDYLEEPAEPNWDYNLVNGEPVYNATTTPGVTGKVSKDFTLPSSTHLEICARILVYAGLHLSNEQLQAWGLTQASIAKPNTNG